MRYEPDWIDGRLVPPRVIQTDAAISGTYSGTVHVEAGRLTQLGTLRGTLVVHSRAQVVIHGTHAGSVVVHEGAVVTVLGVLNGETRVERGALVTVEPAVVSQADSPTKAASWCAASTVDLSRATENFCSKTPAGSKSPNLSTGFRCTSGAVANRRVWIRPAGPTR